MLESVSLECDHSMRLHLHPKVNLAHEAHGSYCGWIVVLNILSAWPLQPLGGTDHCAMLVLQTTLKKKDCSKKLQTTSGKRLIQNQ